MQAASSDVDARRAFSFLASFLFLTLTARAADAYTITSAVSGGCHEGVTSEALREVRRTRPEAAPIPVRGGDDAALVADLPFEPDADMRDLAAVSLLLGVRDNDLKGKSPKDLSRLASVHGNPELQPEHCLRGPDRLEPNGTARAVEDCHAFVLRRVAEALDGLDARGAPDAARRQDLAVHLSIRGGIDVALVHYWVRMGQAVHAVQDSFTHTYRTPDSERITVTLDWFNTVRGQLDEQSAGPPHLDALDTCDDRDALRKRRRELAVEATRAMIDVTLDPSLTRDGKLAAVAALLERHLGYEPGCTYANGWCDAPERKYANESACGCRTAGGARDEGLLAFASALGLILLATWRRCARRMRSVVLCGTLALLALPREARADDAPAEPATAVKTPEGVVAEADAAEAAAPPPRPAVAEPGPKDPRQLAFGGALGAAGSFDRAAAAVSAGLRLRINERWAVGLDGEWNPFLGFTGAPVRSGTFNVYGSVMVRFRLARESVNLRTTLSVGASRLLIDLYGAPRGTTGIYAGIYPLGLEWKAARWCYVVFNPLGAAVPIPQLSGVPFLYPQYRTNVGVEAYF